ncbi:SDR family oxidoreductase [Haloferula chungangensis]|uniref:SDR family oxidoreductase n=1 Tax=Haloferula chungangensis TaxID=1048331 RepID=A0ABW2L635_9BACT
MKTKTSHSLAVTLRLLLICLVSLTTSTFAEDKAEKLTILVTGANRGLGLEYAKQYRAGGHQVIGTARKPDEAVELKATGAEVVKLDVTDDEDIANLAKGLKGRRIDVLINNAGYLSRDQTREALTLSFSVNTLGPLFVSRALTPNLQLSDAPKVINVSSRAGRLTDGTGNMTGYAISKTAVNMVTRNLHSQLNEKGFVVISLAPGRNQTAMGGKGAPLKPEESVSQIIKFIASLDQTHSGGFWYYDGTELEW